MSVNLTQLEIYMIACMLTGMLRNETDKKHKKRLEREVNKLVLRLNYHHAVNYHQMLIQMDWTKAEKLKKRYLKLGEDLKKDNISDRMTRSIALISALPNVDID